MSTYPKYVERNVVEPTGVVQVYRDFWWWCAEGDPKRALFYVRDVRDVGLPQCNLSREICKSRERRLRRGSSHPVTLVQIPFAFEPWIQAGSPYDD